MKTQYRLRVTLDWSARLAEYLGKFGARAIARQWGSRSGDVGKLLKRLVHDRLP